MADGPDPESAIARPPLPIRHCPSAILGAGGLPSAIDHPPSDIPAVPGHRVRHAEFGAGVVLQPEAAGFVLVFFQGFGERRVPLGSLTPALTWTDEVVAGLRPATAQSLERLWLAVEAERLPLMDNAAALTSAKVDLLPHQVVLVHRVATSQPRRLLVADEVGLGKTIETALILRELASRGELSRALMVVPAGLVDNWRHELNDVFNLDFEVFGVEGDVTDRRSNAFARHNRLIASVDTLKQPRRIARLREAPPWDLVVFDEAHHLSVYKTGRKVRKTESFKLAEALRDHCRDLLLLSATPHQGDHFRFWQLIRLLEPALFTDEDDMVENRHRLNAVVARRTKADACAADGSPLFARRVVHTQAFTLSEPERAFYEQLLLYLADGYDLAARQGGQGRALGFVMTIFQKIAASSFLAVRGTLRRRLLLLTVREAMERDDLLDIDGRNALYAEARDLIREMYGFADDAVGRAQCEQMLVEIRLDLLQRARRQEAMASAAESYGDSELAAAAGAESAAEIITVALPEERLRIRQLLDAFPPGLETKTRVLLDALRQLWGLNPAERIVLFTTYLGSVDGIRRAIEDAFPGKGVEVLQGGDHGAKLSAQRRFKRRDGPRVLVCTAAGREGINLQFARVLFNYDLPWNPMDLEQRIGRIHRYGQQHTAQVYNLVAGDTIEGRIYLLLERKLYDIAVALGKLDENGDIAEDLRGQILGQLGTQLSYDSLYREALRDPTLTRTRQELDVAMENADRARRVVFDLFQDLERFDLSDYRRHDDGGVAMGRLVDFVKRAAAQEGHRVSTGDEGCFTITVPQGPAQHLTTDRDKALQADHLGLVGTEHPLVQQYMTAFRELPAAERALAGAVHDSGPAGVLTVWRVTVHVARGQTETRVIPIGLSLAGERNPRIERLDLLSLRPAPAAAVAQDVPLGALVDTACNDILHRELQHSGVLSPGASYTARLLALVRFCP